MTKCAAIFALVPFSIFPAYALEYEFDAAKLIIDSTLSVGSAWRVSERDERQLAQANLGVLPGVRHGASNPNTDDGNWNFAKGDTYSKIVKGFTELSLASEDAGLVLSANYFYDFELKDESRAEDKLGYRRRLNEQTLAQSGSDFQILNAYGFINLAWTKPITLKVGRQTLNWGEGLFLQGGISSINPIDIGGARQPGAQLKEFILPSEYIDISMTLNDQLSLEAFYQLRWRSTQLEGCGTYFSTNDVIADGCGPIVLLNSPDAQHDQLIASEMGVLPRIADREPDDHGQFGLALRGYVEESNGWEWGLYYINYHSRLPYFSGFVVDPFLTEKAANLPIVGSASYFREYPEDIHLWGATLSGSLESGWSWAGEFSFYEDMPIQWNASEIIHGGGMRLYSRHLQQRMDESGVSNPLQLSGMELKGYDRMEVSQLQLSTIKSFTPELIDAQVFFLAEAGAVYINNFPDVDSARYGRQDAFGHGNFSGLPSEVYRDLNPFISDTYSCDGKGASVALNSNPGYCDAEGYTSQFSWGYVTALWFEFNAMVPGLSLQPRFNFTHDVKGYSPSPLSLFVEDRKSLGLSLTVDYLLSKYAATISYVNYFDGGRHNLLNDRDYISVSVAYSF